MTLTSPHTPVANSDLNEGRQRRPSIASRRFGYALSIAINVVLIYLVNEWPGWQSLSFMTADAERVIPIINASMVIIIVANALYLIADPRWLRAIGEAITAAVSFVAIACLLGVFPFDFSDLSFDWETLVRVLLVLGLVGSAVSVIANLVTFIREVGKA